MNKPDQHRTASFLRQALPPVENPGDGPARDLWPQMLGRLDEKRTVPWFDWAMLAGLCAVLLLFPASVPVLLYYL
jgi:hypothetical protein